MEKISLSGCTSLIPNNLITFQTGDSCTPVVCGKDSVITGSSNNKAARLKINFKEDHPIRICKLTKGRFVIVAERKIFLYQFPGSSLDTYSVTEGSVITAASSSEENSRFYVGLENGSICFLKVTGNTISLETNTPSGTSGHQITCMANNTEQLVTCDDVGNVKCWDIKFSVPKLINLRQFSDTVFTCACLTTDGVILGTLFGEIIVLQQGKTICTINAHTGSVTTITLKHNVTVSPQLCLSTGEDGKILIFTALGSVIKNDVIGEYLLTGARWTSNGVVMLSAYGTSYAILHPIQ